MAKDPAFLFYPNDWLGGTMTLDRRHKGAYMDLICLQFNQGPLTIEDVKDVLNGDFDVCWPKLKKKFTEKNNTFFNKRLEQERNKRKKYSESRRSNRLQSKIKPKKHMSDTCQSYEEHMENENENENEDRNVNKNMIKFDEARKIYPGKKRGLKTEYFDFIKKNKPAIVELIYPAIVKQIEYNKRLRSNNKFCPEWKHFRTWINQKCWEEELPNNVEQADAFDFLKNEKGEYIEA